MSSHSWPAMLHRRAAAQTASTWPMAALLLARLLLMCAPCGAAAVELTLEQHLLAEARADADNIVQHRRSGGFAVLDNHGFIPLPAVLQPCSVRKLFVSTAKVHCNGSGS